MMMEGEELNINNNNNNNNGKVFRKCGRWNPTSEQVKVLTDLFRSGLRTPSTDQIQTISSQLSFYGKIESKNVFYWFQNHKARERHKRRKTSSNTSQDIITNPKILEPSERVILETLQLFPLKSNNGCSKENVVVSDHHQSLTQKDHVTPLDLRLSSYIL